MNEACMQPRPCIDAVWDWTGGKRCNGSFVEHEYKSNCGTIEWRIEREVAWVDTGQVRCTTSGVEKEQRNDCNATRWVAGGALTWTDTGETRCATTNVQSKQVNQCGDTRWVDKEAVVWTDTGDTRCSSSYVQIKQINQCGAIRWVDSQNVVTWTDTGETRCEAFRVQRKQVTQCGEFRWLATSEVCGYCADVELPGIGYAYSEANTKRDPAATTILRTSTGAIIGYVYPTASGNNGRVAPIALNEHAGCDACAAPTILGYAALNCCADICHTKSTTCGNC